MNTPEIIGLDQRFGLAVKDFEFTMPADYEHDSQLDTFAEKAKRLLTTRYFDNALSSANFRNATNKLMPGKTYRVRIFPVLETVTSEDCMTFLRNLGAILVGGQGITLLADKKVDEFPIGKWTASFDEKDALWEDIIGNHRVPDVGLHSDGGRLFCLGSFEHDWSGPRCLLCFCDL